MTARDDAVEAVKAILLRDATNMHRTSPVELVDAVEPIIRADERGKVYATIQAGEIPASLYEEMVYDEHQRLRAQVEALPTVRMSEWDKVWYAVDVSDVLRLLDGESDG